jgi:hypothetical protein
VHGWMVSSGLIDDSSSDAGTWSVYLLDIAGGFAGLVPCHIGDTAIGPICPICPSVNLKTIENAT